jgi:hypothetical protein
MGVKFSNNGHSTLAASITSSDTSITVASGHGARFPSLGAGDYFYATLIDASNNLEIVKCTARSSDVLTVSRGQESTTARSYAIADRIELRVTATGIADATDVDNILPSQTSNSGRYLTTDGTNSSWGVVNQYSLPSQTGNSGKFLTTNGTSESWGIAGGIIQVKNIEKGAVQSFTGTSETQVSSFEVSITPSSTSNKILVMGHLWTSSSIDTVTGYTILKRKIGGGSYALVGNHSSSTGNTTDATGHTGTFSGSWNLHSTSFQLLDAPATTSSVTYTMFVRQENGSATQYINRTGRDNTVYHPRVTSAITVMEIASGVL